MRITFERRGYNARRYGKPWIAVVTDWQIGKRPEVRWGHNFTYNIAEVDAEPGAVIRYGQKDYRRSWQSENEWAVVSENGTLIDVTPKYAREHWLAGCPVLKAEEEEAA